jgi:hypothetical protein
LDRWLHLKPCGLSLDFRRIQRIGFGLSCLTDYIISLPGFEERSLKCESDEVRREVYDRVDDDILVFVKSIGSSENVEKSVIENHIENLINLHHPCIASPIGFVFRFESGCFR